METILREAESLRYLKPESPGFRRPNLALRKNQAD